MSEGYIIFFNISEIVMYLLIDSTLKLNWQCLFAFFVANKMMHFSIPISLEVTIYGNCSAPHKYYQS